MKIDKSGKRTVEKFNADKLCYDYGFYPYHFRWRTLPNSAPSETVSLNAEENDYIDELKTVAHYFGYSDDYIDFLLAEGYTLEDIEEVLYCA